jgi:peroxiredoxin
VERHRDRGFVVLGLNSEDDEAKEAEFARAKELPYPVLLGMKAVMEAYGTQAFPTNILIDREGNVRERQVGFSEAALVKALEALLDEKAGETPR